MSVRSSSSVFRGLLALAGFLVSVAAHGCQEGLAIGSGPYMPSCNINNLGAVQNNFSWHVDTISPVQEFASNVISCNRFNNKPTTPPNGTVAAVAGDTVTVWLSQWAEAPAAYHYGPIVVYMAHCGDTGSCSTCDVSKANTWAKIYERGWLPDVQQWASQYAGFSSNSSFSFQLPSQLPTGCYVIRPEVLSLQFTYPNGPSQTGAQPFPACHSFDIQQADGDAANTGDTCLPSSSSLISLPGDASYQNESLSYLIWDTPDGFQSGKLATNVTNYAIPGGALATFPCGPALVSSNSMSSPSTASDSTAGTTGVASSPARTKAIIAGAAGGIGGLVLLLLCIWCCFYRKRESEEEAELEAVAKEIQAAKKEKDRSMWDRDSASYCSTPSKKSLPPSEYAASGAAYSSPATYVPADYASHAYTSYGYAPSASPSYPTGAAHSFYAPTAPTSAFSAGGASYVTREEPPRSASRSFSRAGQSAGVQSSWPSGHGRSLSDSSRYGYPDYYEPSRGHTARTGRAYDYADTRGRSSAGRSASRSGSDAAGSYARAAPSSRYNHSHAGFSRRDDGSAHYY